MHKPDKTLIIIAITVSLMAFLCSLASADRGSFVMRPIEMKENVNVYDAGQKAIICWDDSQELMILSTDKYTSHEAKVLEFMPLPSKPDRVEKASFESFKAIAELIKKHRPKLYLHYRLKGNGGRGRGPAAGAKEAESPVEIVFHKKIGAHDISIGKVKRMEGFTDWVKKFLKQNQLKYRPEDVQAIKPVVSDYLDRGYNYFVFDVIELSPEKKTIEPILYQFKSDELYFPLKVTTLSRGITNINLYLFTPFRTDIWGTDTGFASGFYKLGRKVMYNHPIKFKVNEEEMNEVSEDVRKFMKNSSRVWFSTAHYEGPTSNLVKDFIMNPPRGASVPDGLTTAR